jgi:hypothetical protein
MRAFEPHCWQFIYPIILAYFKIYFYFFVLLISFLILVIYSYIKNTFIYLFSYLINI